MAGSFQHARALRNVLALGTVLLATPASAEPPYPTVDFQADWVRIDDGTTTIRARMHYSAALKKMRIDMTRQGELTSSVRDMGTGEMITWSSKTPGEAVRLPKLDNEEFDGAPTGQTMTIGAETCAVWQMKSALSCLTSDNIPLRSTGKSGYATLLENLERKPQDAAIFEIPEGLRIRDMPVSVTGANPDADKSTGAKPDEDGVPLETDEPS